MKKFLAFAFLLCLSVCAQSQTIKTLTIQSWTNGVWINDTRMTNNADSKGYVINTLQEIWTPSVSLWKTNAQTNYTNTSSGSILKAVQQDWIDSNSTWHTNSQQLYTYTSKGLLDSIVYQYDPGNGSGMQNSSIVTHTYDPGDFLISQMFTGWNGQNWLPTIKRTYTNNPAGFPTVVLSQQFSGGQWVNQGLITYTYNLQNSVTESVNQIWAGSWKFQGKTVFVYDANNNLVQTNAYNWSSSNWVHALQVDHTLRPDGTIDYEIYQGSGGSGLQNLYKYMYSWYPPGTTGVAEQSDPGLLPLTYYDLNGKKITKQSNTVLIEERGKLRRKVYFVE